MQTLTFDHDQLTGGSRPTVALMLEDAGGRPGGGAEIVLLQLGEQLRRLGHEVCPVVLSRRQAPGWLEAEFTERGITPEALAIRSALDVRCLRDLIRILRRRRVTVLHSHEFSMAVYGAAAARWLRLPHVITMHGNMWMTDAWRRRAALRWAIRNSTATVAVSQETRRQLETDLGLPDHAIGTVWNGMPDVPGDRQPVRAELGLAPETVLLVALGTLIERKGHAVLLQSLAELTRRHPGLSWHLAIAGDGPERERLAALAAEGGIAERVHLLGFRSDVANLLAAAEVFVMPSWWEGLPLALLEAMFAGNAIVASDVSGIPEAIPGPEYGILVPPRDAPALTAALADVLRDGTLRARLGQAAQARAREVFSVERMARDYERLYGRPAHSHAHQAAGG
jgi:glycosyltransferase involved in cell wall biosynthesis